VPEQSPYNPVTSSVFRVVIFGTWFVIAAITLLLSVNYSIVQNPQTTGCLWVCGAAFAYISVTYTFLRRQYYTITAYLIVVFYLLLASGIAWQWGINTPIGPLIFGTVIVLAGILLTARHALFAGIVSGLILLTVQATKELAWHHPDTSWTSNQPSFGDVLGYSVVFGMLALVSWLYNREMKRSLAHAKRAEAALRRQKSTLKRQVRERTKDLQRLQLEEMRHMYRFAELGHLGVTLLHDLANHLTALTLEMEGIKETRDSKEIARAQQITQYLGDIVDSTRQRLHGETQNQTFDSIRKINETVDFLHHKAMQNNVILDWQPPMKSLKYIGDPASFCQIIAILTNNAIDAYDNAPHGSERKVTLVLQRTSNYIVIRIKDWGKGIAKKQRKQLFTPHYSTKKSGLGLGLYIAKQTVEMLFSGTMALNPRTEYTEFIIKLPRIDER
jgi:signal transduction histidine kinase